MTDLEKLFNEILLQLKEESKKYKRLKICKYSFEISKYVFYLLQQVYLLLIFLLYYL